MDGMILVFFNDAVSAEGKERAPGTHWTGGWVAPRAVLDAVVKRKICSFLKHYYGNQ